MKIKKIITKLIYEEEIIFENIKIKYYYQNNINIKNKINKYIFNFNKYSKYYEKINI